VQRDKEQQLAQAGISISTARRYDEEELKPYWISRKTQYL
jgi:hypothetical protein